MMYTVKLSKRAALRMLQNEECKIIIAAAHKTDTFMTKPGIFEHDGVQSVYIPKERIIVPVIDVTKIEMPVSRFTPDKMCMMEVDWQ